MLYLQCCFLSWWLRHLGEWVWTSNATIQMNTATNLTKVLITTFKCCVFKGKGQNHYKKQNHTHTKKPNKKKTKKKDYFLLKVICQKYPNRCSPNDSFECCNKAKDNGYRYLASFEQRGWWSVLSSHGYFTISFIWILLYMRRSASLLLCIPPQPPSFSWWISMNANNLCKIQKEK